MCLEAGASGAAACSTLATWLWLASWTHAAVFHAKTIEIQLEYKAQLYH